MFLPFVLFIVQRLGSKDSAHLRFHIEHPSRVPGCDLVAQLSVSTYRMAKVGQNKGWQFVWMKRSYWQSSTECGWSRICARPPTDRKLASRPIDVGFIWPILQFISLFWQSRLLPCSVRIGSSYSKYMETGQPMHWQVIKPASDFNQDVWTSSCVEILNSLKLDL